MTISDLGEFDFLDKHVIPRRRASVADYFNDCTTVPTPDSGSIVWTIDPLPTPVAWKLGMEDPWILGWYSVLVNYSDLAANGARPLGLLVSLELPADSTPSFYERFDAGMKDACREYGGEVLGGNVRASDKFRATATALGIVTARSIGRTGVQPADKIVVIGETGLFWAAVIAAVETLDVSTELSERLQRALIRPAPHIKAGQVLSQLDCRVACMDCSDGVLTACFQLARLNNVDFALRTDVWQVADDVRAIYDRLEVPVEAACYAWGEWQLLSVVSPEDLSQLVDALRREGLPAVVIGEVVAGDGQVVAFDTGNEVNPRMINERFRDDAMEQTVESLIDRFLRQPLFPGQGR